MKRFYILILLLLNLYGWSQVKTDSLIKASFAMKNDSNKVNIYVKIARELLYTDALKALNYCDTAEILAKKLKYKRGLSKAYNAKGIYYRNISDFDNGFKYQFEAIKLAEDLKDNKLLGGAFNNLGILFKNQGNYKKSIYYLKLAHLAFGKIGDKSSQATALQNLSNTYRRAKQPDVAIVYSLQSLKIFDDLNDIFGRASAYNSLGAVYMDDKGEYNKALNYFLQAEKNCLKLNDLKGLSVSYQNVGGCYLKMKNYKPAEIYTRKALDLSIQLRNREQMMESYVNLSSIYEAMGNTEKALVNYKLYHATSDTITISKYEQSTLELEERFQSAKSQKEIELLSNLNTLKTKENKYAKECDKKKPDNNYLRYSVNYHHCFFSIFVL